MVLMLSLVSSVISEENFSCLPPFLPYNLYVLICRQSTYYVTNYVNWITYNIMKARMENTRINLVLIYFDNWLLTYISWTHSSSM